MRRIVGAHWPRALSTIVAILLVAFVPANLNVPLGPYVLLLIVAISAWYGGVRSGLVVAALSTFIVRYAFMSPAHSLAISPLHVVGMIAYLIAAFLFSVFAVSCRRSAESWREIERWNRLLNDTAREGIWVINTAGCTTYVNHRLAEMLGFAANQLIGQNLSDFLVEGPAGEALLDFQSRQTITAAQQDVRFRRCDNAKLRAIVNTSTILDEAGEPVGRLLMIEDISERRQAEQELDRALKVLQASEGRHRRLVESNIIGIITAELGGAVVEANDAFLRMVRHTREDMHGGLVNWAEMTPPEFHARDHHGIRELWASGACVPYEKQLFRKDGIRVPVLFGAAALERYPRRWIGFVLDLTERKRAEDALRFLARASEVLASSLDYEETLQSVARLAVPDLADYCVIDLVEENGEIHRLATAHADPALGDLVNRLRQYPPDPNRLDGVPEVLRRQRSYIISDVSEAQLGSIARDASHLELLRALGPHSCLFVPLQAQGRMLGVLTLVATTSGRRYGPADLVLAEDLARRAAQAVDNSRLHRAAQAARQDAEAASLAKDQFLARLSHELRTPLTPVLATATALLEQPASPADLRSALEMFRRNVDLEARLIDDLLDITRIERGKLRLDRQVIDAHDLVRQAVEICHDDIAAGELTLELELKAVEHHVVGDSARLQQVFWNLIKNAVKFTPPGGRLTVRSRNDDEGQPSGRRPLVIEVSDTGLGIDQADLPRIFEAFEQAGAASRRMGGLGLGLAISRSIVAAHGGRLIATSGGRGRGSTFTLSLDTVASPVQAEKPALAPATTETNGRRGLQPLKILLVEDNQDTQRFLAWILSERHHSVRAVGTMTSALEAANQDSFDLVISDIELPDGSGLELMQTIRAGGDVPGIALSGFGSEEDVALSRASGFMAHMTKPVDFRKLEAMIEEVTAAPHGSH